ncbi:hypothetical protein EMCRGX_G032208 [Ephydatia muelleri]
MSCLSSHIPLRANGINDDVVGLGTRAGNRCVRRSIQSLVTANGKELSVTWPDGAQNTYSAVWLRHNCECSACKQPHSGQKVVDAGEVTQNLHISSDGASDGLVKLKWRYVNGLQHSGFISTQQLRESVYTEPQDPPVATALPHITHGELYTESRHGLWSFLKYLNDYGMCLVTGVPAREQEVKKFTESIFEHVQTTIYGQVFDVVSTPIPINIAYTPVKLDLHMDLAYYESPPGLQLLHCLKFDDCVTGGESVLLDSLPVLEELKRKYPTYFDTLVSIPATFQKIHYERQNPTHMVYRRPHITVNRHRKVIGFFWAPVFEGPLVASKEDVDQYYKAYSCLSELFQNSTLKIQHRLTVGELLVFNNRRVLHGRNAFTLNGGIRHLQGAYVNIDEFKSTFEFLSRQLKLDGGVRNVFNQSFS